MTELIAEPIQDLLDFYSEHYPETRFGTMDLEALQHAIQELKGAAERVVAAETAAVQARADFGTAETDVLNMAARAVSFLKIHVENDDAQLTRLDAIGNALGVQRRKTRSGSEGATAAVPDARPRRPRKGKNPSVAPLSSPCASEVAEQASSGFEIEAGATIEAEPARSGSFAAVV